MRTKVKRNKQNGLMNTLIMQKALIHLGCQNALYPDLDAQGWDLLDHIRSGGNLDDERGDLRANA